MGDGGGNCCRGESCGSGGEIGIMVYPEIWTIDADAVHSRCSMFDEIGLHGVDWVVIMGCWALSLDYPMDMGIDY